MNKQTRNKGIDWLIFPDGTKGYSWNPVTGCYNNCFYCYAKPIAERFSTETNYPRAGVMTCAGYDDKPYTVFASNKTKEAFPVGFKPTFHWNRLDEPFKKKKPSKIFVCSMADLFGDWIGDIWIERVFDACRKAPQHTYLFLTKNPGRYEKLYGVSKLPIESNFWYGSTISKPNDPFLNVLLEKANVFNSFEPIMGEFSYRDTKLERFSLTHWAIFGAMTKNGKLVEEYKPKWDWIRGVIEVLRAKDIPIFMKRSMKGIVPDDQFTQEFPKEL